MKKDITNQDIEMIVNKILSLRKNKRFTIGKYLNKFNLTPIEKNNYAKQIFDSIKGFVSGIDGGNYTYDNMPWERNDRDFKK